MQFRKATKKKKKLRLAICGPTGSGKTYTALELAKGLGKTVGLIDTEHGASELYAKRFDFEVLELHNHSTRSYVRAIRAAEDAGFDVVVIDSLSHAWVGKGGALEQADNAARKGGNNKFTAWRDVTPDHNALVEAMLSCKAHLIVTMRSKMAYEVSKDEKGKTTVERLGLKPVQREGIEYEFDLVADMDADHAFIVSKSRYDKFSDLVMKRPDREVGGELVAWLNDGEDVPEPPAATVTPIQGVPTADGEGPTDAEKHAVWKELRDLKKDLGIEILAEVLDLDEEKAAAWAPGSFTEAQLVLQQLRGRVAGGAA